MFFKLDPLTPRFWDCECETDFVHHHSIPYCAHCDVYRDEQPDSRVAEVSENLIQVFAEIFGVFRRALLDILAVDRTFPNQQLRRYKNKEQDDELPKRTPPDETGIG